MCNELRADTCPVCERDDSVEGDEVYITGANANQECRCAACGAVWIVIFEVIAQGEVQVDCEACGRLLLLEDHFKEHHVCRGCGKRICDDCYHDNGPTCGAPKCGDWEKWEQADHEYDSYKCDGREDRWGILHVEGEADV